MNGYVHHSTLLLEIAVVNLGKRWCGQGQGSNALLKGDLKPHDCSGSLIGR